MVGKSPPGRFWGPELPRDRDRGEKMDQAQPPAWDPGTGSRAGRGHLRACLCRLPPGPAVAQSTVAGICLPALDLGSPSCAPAVKWGRGGSSQGGWEESVREHK